MAGIAGIVGPKKKETVEKMLNKISHRGNAGREILTTGKLSIGIVWPSSQENSIKDFLKLQIFRDFGGHSRKAEARVLNDNVVLLRDEMGVAPLYYGYTLDGELCFSSEVKALLPVTTDIHELLPGHILKDGSPEVYFHLNKMKTLDRNPDRLAEDLKNKLETAVMKCIQTDTIGSWLSGGIDSSAISALAIKNVKKLHTFAAGISGAPDLDYARLVAKYIGSEHHEIVIDLNEILSCLPRVIYHLESFDALLVRSSIVNFIAGEKAADHVSEIFSGEVGDEIFAGYSYLKSIPENKLEDELIDLISRLHNTALQRVDRCSSAHGILAHVIFADPAVFTYALRIPVKYKIQKGLEKWILRKALINELPERVLNRRKAKFWQGAGIDDMLAGYASENITDRDFQKERRLENGWILHSKEELMYYRLFRNTFGDVKDLSWMGRTK